MTRVRKCDYPSDMNSDDYRDESGLVYVGADIVIALAVFAAAVLGALAAFGLVELARRLA